MRTGCQIGCLEPKKPFRLEVQLPSTEALKILLSKHIFKQMKCAQAFSVTENEPTSGSAAATSKLTLSNLSREHKYSAFDTRH